MVRLLQRTDGSAGSITLLFQDNRGGLQVLSPKNTYVDATPIEDTIVVNAGDLLARWSNDTIKSTKHRVVEPPVKPEHDVHPARYSIAYFCNPNFERCVLLVRSVLGGGCMLTADAMVIDSLMPFLEPLMKQEGRNTPESTVESIWSKDWLPLTECLTVVRWFHAKTTRPCYGATRSFSRTNETYVAVLSVVCRSFSSGLGVTQEVGTSGERQTADCSRNHDSRCSDKISPKTLANLVIPRIAESLNPEPTSTHYSPHRGQFAQSNI